MFKQFLFATLLICTLFLLQRSLVEGTTATTEFIRLPTTQPIPADALMHLNYGAFNWVELPANSVTLNRQVVQVADFTLHLGGRSFDPLTLPAADIHTTAETDFYLIQFIGPTKQSWLDQLTASDIVPVQYIHPHTYVVWANGESLSPVTARSAAWPFIRWRGQFEPDYRVVTLSKDLPQSAADDTQLFNALIYRGQNTETMAIQVAKLGGAFTVGTTLNTHWQLAQLQLPREQLAAAATIPGIYTIQPAVKNGGSRSEFNALINVGQHDMTYNPFPGYLTWLTERNLSGAGVVVSVVDEGIDENHPDLAGRMATCTGTTCTDVVSVHGSHTAGIIAADGSSGITDTSGFLRGLGIAPQATLVEQRYFDDSFVLYDIATLMTDSSRNQAIISSNSWGPSGSPQGYDLDTMMVDIGVRDADADAAGYQPLTYVVAIMNGFGGYQSQGSPDEAKNAISVGSTENRQFSGIPAAEINNISLNSAHGPALDGRNLPLIVAPGAYVDSTTTDNSYQYLVGTSMAAPQVSGAAALFVDYYRQQFNVDPSPALIKAALLPVTHSLINYQDADREIMTERFGSKQGWGRLDLAAVVDPQTAVLYYDSPAIFEESGESWSLNIVPANPDQPVKMMLVWTDAPGHGLGGTTPAWSNDLDLQLRADGQVYYANNFDEMGWSVSGGAPDGQHNTEGILLPSAQTGILEVTISATNISSDGLPEQGDMLDQDFAFVCYNCELFQTGHQYYLSLIMNR